MNTEKKLPEDFKQRWVAALRSGEYKQGNSSLFDGEKYCCLGVACAIAGSDNIPSCEFIGDTIVTDDLYTEKYRPNGIPDILIGHNGITGHLAEMNDGVYNKVSPKSFSEIADWIEQNL